MPHERRRSLAEEVRQHLEREYGARDLYESGLEVYTTLDVELQRMRRFLGL